MDIFRVSYLQYDSPSSFMTHIPMLNNIHCGTGTAYTFGAREFTPGF